MVAHTTLLWVCVFTLIFAVIAYLGFAKARDDARVQPSFSFVLVGAAVAILVGMFNTPTGLSGAIVQTAIGFLFVIPVLVLVGPWCLGLIVGYLGRIHPLFRYLIMPVMAAPLALFGLIYSQLHADELLRQARIAEAEQQQFVGLFGQHTVSLPASPQARIRRNCWRPGVSVAFRCSMFTFQDGTHRATGPDGTEPTRLFELELRQVHPSCDRRLYNVSRGCTTQHVLAAWCSKRVDLPENVWCGSQQMDHIIFIQESERERSFRSYEGLPVIMVAIPAALQSGGLQLRCWEDRSRGQICQGDFEIAEDITVHLLLAGADETTAVDRTVAARRFAAEIWSDMTLADGQG